MRDIGSPSLHQLWLFPGRPGEDSYSSLSGLVKFFSGHSAFEYTDLYMVDFRGTGPKFHQSNTEFTCPKTMSNNEFFSMSPLNDWIECSNELKKRFGDNINYYNLEMGIQDILYIIQHFHDPVQDHRVYAYGLDYGSVIINGLLQYNRDLFDRVILDGTPIVDYRFYSKIIDEENRIFEYLLAACDEYDLCSSHLKGDPEKFSLALKEKVFSSSSVCNIFKKIFEGSYHNIHLFFRLLMQNIEYRPSIPVLIFRMDRCSPKDYYWISEKYKLLMSDYVKEDTNWQVFNFVLYQHLILSEFWAQPSSPLNGSQYYDKLYGETFLSTGLELPVMYDLYNDWPRAQQSEGLKTFAETDVPILILNGGLNILANTASSEAAKKGYNNARFIQMDSLPSGCLMKSYTNFNNLSITCGIDIAKQFFVDEMELNAINTMCIENIKPVLLPNSELPSYLKFVGPFYWADVPELTVVIFFIVALLLFVGSFAFALYSVRQKKLRRRRAMEAERQSMVVKKRNTM
eukprot:TRINITY_DN1905_c0_g1_i3.p1 TRINITY_DN1905_c0_g1~~TRINITY_DN1905_c0_g1_i3.p1  ORF type:complete len:515 (-),score=86.49 TRINITY_DN1905_c0_g1_i3:44-1588(-)